MTTGARHPGAWRPFRDYLRLKRERNSVDFTSDRAIWIANRKTWIKSHSWSQRSESSPIERRRSPPMMARLRVINEGLRAQQERRLQQAYTSIAEEVKELLTGDLRRQDIFADPKNVHFTFAEKQRF